MGLFTAGRLDFLRFRESVRVAILDVEVGGMVVGLALRVGSGRGRFAQDASRDQSGPPTSPGKKSRLKRISRMSSPIMSGRAGHRSDTNGWRIEVTNMIGT